MTTLLYIIWNDQLITKVGKMPRVSIQYASFPLFTL